MINQDSPRTLDDYIEQIEQHNAQLQTALKQIIRAGEYVCMHKFGNGTPAGTRIIAVSDLAEQIKNAKQLLPQDIAAWPNEKS